MGNAIHYRTVNELAREIREMEVSSSEVLEAHLARIQRMNSQLHAIATLDVDGARSRAAAADVAVAKGEIWGPLHGVPVTIKDSFMTAGLSTTSGVPKLRRYVPSEDAVAVARLRAAGAIILGKTNMAPLAGDVQTRGGCFPTANNPWNFGYTPGGSTGGGAAAVASGLSPLELGSDIAGSIRLPAHFCGVFGLKPTEHRVPNTGHIPELPGRPNSIRHMGAVGLITRSVDDLRMGLSIIAGADQRRWHFPPVPIDTPSHRPLRDRVFGWTDSLGGLPVSTETTHAVSHLAKMLRNAGCRVEQVEPPGLPVEEALELWANLFASEVGGSLRWWERLGMRSMATLLIGHGALRRGFLKGIEQNMSGFAKVLTRRDKLITAMDEFMGRYDAWLCPVSARSAFPHSRGFPPIEIGHETRLPYFVATIAHTCIFNLMGNPVVVLPTSMSATGMPVGVQVVGRLWRDMELLELAGQIAEAMGPFPHPSL